MPPNATNDCTGVLHEQDAETIDGGLNKQLDTESKPDGRKLQLKWVNIIAFTYVHIAALYGGWLMLSSARIYTGIFAYLLYVMSGLGITAGAHRLYSHKSYKAKMPLHILLIFFNTISFQNSVIEWARDHRVHHKYSETDADPHNAKRGLFFSHIGWLLCKKHPDVKTKGQGVDLSDLKSDPLLRFQEKYYIILMPLCCFVLPTVIPMYFWNETFTNSWFVAAMFRWTFTLNMTWLVNSAAHKWGDKPYDKNINPGENRSVAAVVLGEGWHNYHHTFPWDYNTAELGRDFNVTKYFIDFMAKIGWAYDLKTVPSDIIRKRVERTGDGTHHIWGWGDKDLDKSDRDNAIIMHKKH